MVFITSDLHIGHNRGFIYEPRGFKNVEEHDEALIQRWNATIRPEDEVYILGDIMLNNNEHGIAVLKQLNGKKYFIRGNHDTDIRIKLYIEAGLKYLGYASQLKYGKYQFYLSHYPTLTGNLETDNLKQMTLNLFGHTHSAEKFFQDRPYMYNVAMDAHNCIPISLDEIIVDMKNKMNECKEVL